MLIIRADEHGGPEVLRPVDRPVPRPSAGQLLVDLAWSGVLSLDALLRRGAVPPTFEVQFPWTPGQGGAGVVIEVGQGIDDRWIGTRVLVDQPGSYTEQMITTLDRVVPIPDEVDLDQAMALLHDGSTAVGLLEAAVGDSAEQQTVAITPAAGGAGSVLVQLAVRDGHRVIAIVGGAAKAEFVRSLGADAVVDHRQDGWLERLRSERPTVLFDGVGGAGAADLLNTVRPGGSYLNYGNAGGDFVSSEHSSPDGVRVIGGEILSRLFDGRRERQERILKLAAAGEVRAHIGARFDLAAAADAHRALRERAVVGKALLDCRLGSAADG